MFRSLSGRQDCKKDSGLSYSLSLFLDKPYYSYTTFLIKVTDAILKHSFITFGNQLSVKTCCYVLRFPLFGTVRIYFL